MSEKQEPQKLVISIDAQLQEDGTTNLALSVDLDCNQKFAIKVMQKVMEQSEQLQDLFTTAILHDMFSLMDRPKKED